MAKFSPARRGVVALLLLPLLLLVAGCLRMEMDIELLEDETGNLSMEVRDSSGFLSREDVDCEAASEEGPSPDLTWEEIGEEGSYGCRASGNMPLADFNEDGMSIVVEDGNYVFTMDGTDSDEWAEFDELEDIPFDIRPEIDMSVTFPGEVIEADDNAEVDGNTVRWSGSETLREGASATGAASAQAGIPMLAVVIVLGVVAAVALVVMIVLLSKLAKRRASARVAPAPAVASAPPGAQPYAGDYYPPAPPPRNNG